MEADNPRLLLTPCWFSEAEFIENSQGANLSRYPVEVPRVSLSLILCNLDVGTVFFTRDKGHVQYQRQDSEA